MLVYLIEPNEYSIDIICEGDSVTRQPGNSDNQAMSVGATEAGEGDGGQEPEDQATGNPVSHTEESGEECWK